MFRSLSRTAVVAVVALTLALASVPAVHANPFGPGTSLDSRAGWLDVALSWLSGFLFGEESSQPEPRSAVAADETIDASLDDFSSPQSGGCIDPEGRPSRCY